MPKVYVKRNINELAEITFGAENYTCSLGLACSLIWRLTNSYVGSINLDWELKSHERICVGTYTKEHIDQAFKSWFDSEVAPPKDLQYFKEHVIYEDA